MDTPAGGIFSRCLIEVAAEGIKSSDAKKEHLTLRDISLSLKREFKVVQ